MQRRFHLDCFTIHLRLLSKVIEVLRDSIKDICLKGLEKSEKINMQMRINVLLLFEMVWDSKEKGQATFDKKNPRKNQYFLLKSKFNVL